MASGSVRDISKIEGSTASLRSSVTWTKSLNSMIEGPSSPEGMVDGSDERDELSKKLEGESNNSSIGLGVGLLDE
jgi:hypothetical protein